MNFNNLHKEWLSKPRIVLGMMSGTSLDGIDICASCFSVSQNGKHQFELFHWKTYPMDQELRENIKQCIQHEISIKDISFLQKEITHAHANIVNQYLDEFSLDRNSIDLLSVHGQTVWHSPPSENNSYSGHTYQLISIPALSALTQICSIGDFRSADIALGGQGAPLVPIFDKEFLCDSEVDTIAINIGGMANMTIIPADSTLQLSAFDTGPGNILIDEAMISFFGKKYDTNGSFAKAGRRINRLWDNLCELEFITEKPPKSTGREFFNKQLLQDILEVSFVNTFPGEDIIRTLTDYTAWSIAENIRLFGPHKARVLITGGGAQNPVLVQELKNQLPDFSFYTSEELGIPADAKEALCFAYLGWRSLAGLPGSLKEATGISKPHILGSIAFS
jgi:anhydro-N-acetylmuramic acid kinase